MSDIKIEIIAKELGKTLDNLAPYVEAELTQAVENLSQAAYASMVAQVQAMQMDPNNRQDYLKGLQYAKIDDSNFIIYLEGEWANQLEQGFSGYSIKDKLLSSTKRVSSGQRAGEPWVRTSKDGKKYAAVPFSHKPFSGEKFNSGDLAEEIKKMTAMNSKGKEQLLTKTFKNLDGNAIAGKVASIKNAKNPLLSGITKYQTVGESGRVSSIYMTFRMVHSDSSGWQHPGFKGYNLFKTAEEYVEKELENILQTLL